VYISHIKKKVLLPAFLCKIWYWKIKLKKSIEKYHYLCIWGSQSIRLDRVSFNRLKLLVPLFLLTVFGQQAGKDNDYVSICKRRFTRKLK